MVPSSQSSRTAFRNQPVHYLIVDLGYPMTNFTLENCIAAVQAALSLGCSIRGSNRIAGFGVSTVGSQFKSVIELDTIKGNYGKFQDAITSLAEMADPEMHTSTDGFKETLLEAITAAIGDFKSKSDNTGGACQFSSQLQITFLTKKSGVEVQEYIEEIFQEVPTSKIKKIMVMELSCPLTKLPINEQNPQSEFEFPQALEFVGLTKVIASKHALEEYFKHWLLDCNTDHEHLRLIFANGAAEDKSEHSHFLQNQNLVLKCDIHECVINPLSLPFGNRFLIQTDFLGFSLGGNTGKVQGSNSVIYELVVLSRLSLGGVCESLLFGQPLRLTPTQCWRLEWSKLLENQQCFSALSQELTTNEEFLLAQLKPHLHSDPVSGYFILVPGEGSLLLKAIAPGEIILPDKNVKFDKGSPEYAPKDVHFKIISTLNELPFYSEYDPHFWKSGLYSALSRNLMSNKRSLRQMYDREIKASDSSKEQGNISKMENIKQKGASPNAIVKVAIAKTNCRGKSQKKSRGTQ